MKLSITGKIRLIIITLLLISFVQGMIIINLTTKLDNMKNLQIDLHNTVYITWFLQFVFSMILIFYLPIFLHKAFSKIHLKLKEISQGNYNIETNLQGLEFSMNKEFYAILVSIKEMLRSIRSFDNLKKEKIIEHHHRIKAILNLTNEGFIIADIKGKIVYINDLVTEIFPQLEENVNIVDSNFPPEIEHHIKKYIIEVLKTERKKDLQQFFIPNLKRHIGLNSALVRNHDGKAIGVVIVFTNLDKK
ncbi:MAG: PAS domain-containing protein [Candidatus Cloacimonetes bacterium]|nr:PAS domain-containing protein [Candidatus Cloacimonadota bacterium]